MKFPRPAVAVGMVEMFIPTEVRSLVWISRGDDIPACPPPAEMIQRSEFARDVIRLVVTGRGRRNQAQVPGRGRQSG